MLTPGSDNYIELKNKKKTMLTKESQLNATVFTVAVLVFGLMAVFSSRQIQADLNVETRVSTPHATSAP
jgi:hypothetical protein